MRYIEFLNVSFKDNWDRPVHRWYRFHAGCSAVFPESVMDFLRVGKEATVLDPFVGSGTTLVCAKLRGINSVGFDVNPLYVFMSRVKTYWEFDLADLYTCMKTLMKDLSELQEFGNVDVTNIPEYIWRYFEWEILCKLSFIKEKVSKIKGKRKREFFLFALASILIDVSRVHYVGETIVFDKHSKSNVDVYKRYRNKLKEMLTDLKYVQNVEGKGKAKVKRCDARNLDSEVEDSSVNFIITHPPYANNYNYLLHDRLPLYFLGYLKKPSDEKQLRNKMIGCVTKDKASIDLEPSLPEIKELASKILSTGDMERCGTILEYFHSMDNVLRIFHKKLRKQGYCAMLVGNSYVRGVMIPLDILIAKMAKKIGFEITTVSKVRDRGNGAFQHIYNGRLYESIVIFKKS